MPGKRILTGAVALLLAVSFAAPSSARALSADGFEYTVTGSDATVTRCTSTCPATLVIPSALDGSTVTGIGDYAFYSNALTAVTIPNTVTSIGSGAFQSNSLTAVTIPNSVKFIGDRAFYRNLLTTVTIPNTVTSIGSRAFRDNLLTTVTIGYSVTSIGTYAFYDNLLTSVTFLGDAPTDVANVFGSNSGLAFVTRPYAATGWGPTWSGVTVVTAAGPTPTPAATPTPSPSSTASPTPTPSLTGSPEPSASSDPEPSASPDPEPSASPDTGGVEPSSTDGDAAPWLIALLLLLASGTVAAGIRLRQRESRRK